MIPVGVALSGGSVVMMSGLVGAGGTLGVVGGCCFSKVLFASSKPRKRTSSWASARDELERWSCNANLASKGRYFSLNYSRTSLHGIFRTSVPGGRYPHSRPPTGVS